MWTKLSFLAEGGGNGVADGEGWVDKRKDFPLVQEQVMGQEAQNN